MNRNCICEKQCCKGLKNSGKYGMLYKNDLIDVIQTDLGQSRDKGRKIC